MKIFAEYTLPDSLQLVPVYCNRLNRIENELKYMELLQMEPRNFGLKVLDHPGQLAITSAGKRRNSERLSLSFSGTISQTVVFDQSKSEINMKALATLVAAADTEAQKVDDPLPNGTIVWHGIGHETITEFLDAYCTDAEAATVVDPRKMSQFIKEQIIYGDNDLKSWTLAVVSKTKSEHKLELVGKTFGCVERSPIGSIGDNFAIGTLISPTDESLDFSKSEMDQLLESIGKDKATGKEIREARPKQRGLLIVYPIYFDNGGPNSYGVDANNRIYGVAVSFPGSDTTVQVKYEVNSVYQDAED